MLLMGVLALSITAFTIPGYVKNPTVEGAWLLQNGSESQVLTFTDQYYTHTSYNESAKKFVQTTGGPFKLNKGELVFEVEFDTKFPELVGKKVKYGISQNGNDLTVDFEGKKSVFKRIDDGNAPLAGVWHITSRMQDGRLVPIHRTGTRKTLKILTGKRFQWVAIDPAKKEFSGTGGGTYCFNDGVYTENIEFFSRDSSRIGASLSFDGKLEDGNWHHSGLSSKGDKIYEVWSKVKE